MFPIADSGMMILAKKNVGLFSHNAAIHPNTKQAFHFLFSYI